MLSIKNSAGGGRSVRGRGVFKRPKTSCPNDDKLFQWFRTVFTLNLPANISEQTMRFFFDNPSRLHIAFHRMKKSLKVNYITTAGHLNLSEAFVIENFGNLIKEPVEHEHLISDEEIRIAFGKLFFNRFENVFSLEFVSYFKKTGQIELQACLFDLGALLENVSVRGSLRNFRTVCDMKTASARHSLQGGKNGKHQQLNHRNGCLRGGVDDGKNIVFRFG